eukprot:UN26578
MSAFRGTASTDLGIFPNKTKKMLNKINFPQELDTRIDMTNIKFDTFKQWIALKVEAIIGIDDDILVGTIINFMEKERFPDPRVLYITLVPFLETKVRGFMKQLWNLLTSAQENGTGVPQEMIDAVKKENQEKRHVEARYGQKLRQRYDDQQKKMRDTKRQNMRNNMNNRDQNNRRRDRSRSREFKNRYQNGRPNDNRRDHRDQRDRGDRGRGDRRERKQRKRSPSPPRISSHRKSSRNPRHSSRSNHSSSTKLK